MTEHAVLSASSSERWLRCTPSARLEQEFPDSAGRAAREGSAAHALCEYKLKTALGQKLRRPESEFDSEEMEEHAGAYTDFVLEQVETARQNGGDPLVLVEQRLDLSRWVPEGFGTGDCLLITDRALHVIDFKYGTGVIVDARHNSQMMLYALGALSMFGALYDIQDIAMTIFQPRAKHVSTWRLSASQLLQWARQELQPKAALAFKGEGEFHPGAWCRFCRASIRCKARAMDFLELEQEKMAPPATLSDAQIAGILTRIPPLLQWAGQIQEYAADAAIHHGKQWEGFKLVEGRSVRKFIDEDLVKERCARYGYTHIYRTRLLPLTELEKMMGARKFREILSDLVCKSPGKPSLVPISDQRPALQAASAQNDFKEE